MKYAHLGKYIDTFQADKVKENKVDAEMEGCKRKSDGLIDIISHNPEKPSAAEICRWALCHPAQDDHIELPEHFSCHGFKFLGYIYQDFFARTVWEIRKICCAPPSSMRVCQRL